MTLIHTDNESRIASRLISQFGESIDWKSTTGANCALWANLPVEIIAPHIAPREDARGVQLRRTLEDRKHRRATPVILIADSDEPNKVRIVGPHPPYVVRKLNTASVLDLIERSRHLTQNRAAAVLERELRRLDESVLPGIRVRELLTPHYITTRLRQYASNRDRLVDATKDIKRIPRSTTWQSLFTQLGYETERLPQRGYLLRLRSEPVAVVHPLSSPDLFIRMNEQGQLPDGLVISDCLKQGAEWGILVSDLRIRIFQANPNFGSATARYIEIDARELEKQDRLYLGLLSPDALKSDGWLKDWASDARDFGEELRKGLEERIRTTALPNFAKGIGKYLESNENVDLHDREKLREIEEAVLTLVFQFMFMLHVEARGYLPMNSASYYERSARKLADESKKEPWEYDQRSTRLWDSMRTLTRMIRHGDKSVGVPAYNGSLFAPDRFPGAALLEEIAITDDFVAPAIYAIAFDPDQPDAGLDYAGLQIGHLGAIYEALLSLKLTRSSEDLIYDARRDVYRPMQAGEEAGITASELFYQTEKGGRKSGGVYYTREEFVRHLLNHSLRPALDEHLERIKKLADKNQNDAAAQLFDFSVVDPAMGSGHFLTSALDMMADRIEFFLADIGGLPAIRKQLNDLRKGENEDLASVEDVDLLRRLILKRCIYGVDISPMAVEVANVTLWLASFVPGLALSYLGSNLKCGDALIGVAGQDVVDTSRVPLFAQRAKQAMEDAVTLHGKLTNIPDVTPDEVHRSQELDDELREATAGLRRAYDLWTADPLGLSDARDLLELHAEEIVAGSYAQNTQIANKIDEATRIDGDYNFLHWALEFPHVFHQEENPGFDVVVGNPPWNEVTVEELAFYALRDPGLRSLPILNDRRKRIAELDAENPGLRPEFEAEQTRLADIRRFFTQNGGYQLQGVGDKDLYQLFCERYNYLLRQDGRLGVVLPRNALLAQGAIEFRRWLFGESKVNRLDILRNSRQWAFNITPQYRIALLTCQKRRASIKDAFKLTGPSETLSQFQVISRSPGLSVDMSSLGSAFVVPLLPSQAHADILTKLRCGVEFKSVERPENKKNLKAHAAASRLAPYVELHETQQRALFSHPEGIPVWKGRSFYQYDPHGNDPAGYAEWDEVLSYLHSKRKRSPIFKRMFASDYLDDPNTHPVNHCRIAFHHIARATDYRTMIACLIPPRTPLTNAAPYLVFAGWEALTEIYVLGVMNSLIFDWITRRYVEINLNYFILNMLTFPPPDNTPWQRIGELAARLSCVDERFAEFAAEAGVECGPQTDCERDLMRAEIDALVAKAYDLTEDELRFVFKDFTPNAVSSAYRQLVLDKFERL